MLLIGIETVGRLVENQYQRIVEQGLRQTDATLEALRQGLDRLFEDALRARDAESRHRCGACGFPR